MKQLLGAFTDGFLIPKTGAQNYGLLDDWHKLAFGVTSCMELVLGAT